MKLHSHKLTTTSILLLPLATHALGFQLPAFINTFKSRFSTLQIPTFLRKASEPVLSSTLLSLHKSLVEIPSVTGDERAVAEWLATYLVSRNFTVHTQAVGESGRENVFAYIGTSRYTNTLLTSHLDVVPPYIPYEETAESVWGRGSCDAKGSVAAQITAVEELWQEGAIKEGDVAMLFVVGEEADGIGMKTANELNPGWKTVIFGEPTDLKLAVGHKGIAEFNVVAEGKSAHSGYPYLGINANSNLIKALYALDQLQLPSSELLGNSTLNIGQIEGGVAANVVPASAKALISVRVATDLETLVKQIDEAATSAADGVKVEWLPTPHYGPVELDYDVEGFETIVCSYGTDVPNLLGDHKRYLYGPGSILVAHADDEHVLKSDLFDAVVGYKKLVRESLNPTRRPPAIIEPATAMPEESTAEEEVKEPVVSDATIVTEKDKETETEAREPNQEL